MELIFLGSGDFGLPTLRALHESEAHHVAAVVTGPDRPAGRNRRLTPTPIGQWAAKRGLAVWKFEDVNHREAIARLEALEPDASVVVAFGHKLSPALIGSLGELTVNLHASLLPGYRGAAPINWAVIHGEATTGVSVIALAQRMDAGAIYAQRPTPIDPGQTAGELHDRLARLGPDAVLGVLGDLARGRLSPIAQDESLACKAPKLSKRDGTVSLDQPAKAVRDRIHGLTPWPGCRVSWTCRATGQTRPLTLRRARVDPPGESRGERAGEAPGTVLDRAGRVAAADGVVTLTEVQLPGGKPMPTPDFARGHRLDAGDQLTPLP